MKSTGTGVLLQDDFTAVLEVNTRDELQREVVRFTQRLGFETMTAMAVVDHVGGHSDFASVHNTPAAYIRQFRDRNRGRRDPVMQHCKRASVPIMWNQDTYTSIGLGEDWDEQAEHGYCAGIALALHLPRGLHFFIGVDRDKSLPRDASEVSRMVADLHLFAVHAQDAAMRILLPPSADANLPTLTARELESLRWTMDGKTAWEVGRILGISEQTAARHLNNATHKLGCVNKHHAALKAFRERLIR